MTDSVWTANGSFGPNYSDFRNWSNGVPTGTAAFPAGSLTSVVLGDGTIGQWVFGSGSSYTFTIAGGSYTFNGDGILNNAAPVINNTLVLNFESGTAGHAIILNDNTSHNSVVYFTGSSKAGSAIITNRARLYFNLDADANHSTIINDNKLNITSNSTAGSANITNNVNGLILFYQSASAGNAKVSNSGEIRFERGTAGDATITTTAGGEVTLHAGSGGAARFILQGTGKLTLDDGAVLKTVGSIEGNGKVDLNSNTLAIGGNNRSTNFSGLIDSMLGSIVKVGSGTLKLSGANTYDGGTTKVNGGILRIDGSIDSSATVNSGGTLGGHGTINDVVRVNSGGTLSPGAGAGASRLETHSVNFQAGSKFAVMLGGTAPGSGYDQIGVAGTVSLGSPTLSGRMINGFDPSSTAHQKFILIDNDGVDAIVGSFNGLAEGATTVLGDRYFTVSYRGGTGNDVVVTSAGARRVGGSGNDSLRGTVFHDDLFGNDGNDVLKGGGAADVLNGGNGVDVADFSDQTAALTVTIKTANQVVGGDTLVGIEGIYGGSGKDKFTGDSRTNIFRGGGNKDTMDGAGGTDTVEYGDKTTAVAVTLNGATPVTVKVGGVIEDTIRNFENVKGGSAGDKLGGDGAANVLDGRAGNDTLAGGNGNDTLIGGAGKDSLEGGAGNDRFVFNAALGTTNVDTIKDFKHDFDTLALDDAIFKTIGIKLDAVEFYAAAGAVKAHDANDRIIYDRTSGRLFYDDDGNKTGGHAPILFATLTGHPSIDAGDFVII